MLPVSKKYKKLRVHSNSFHSLKKRASHTFELRADGLPYTMNFHIDPNPSVLHLGPDPEDPFKMLLRDP